MRIVFSAKDAVLKRWGDRLVDLGARQMTRIGTMALNSEGRKGRTKVIAALEEQTGMRKSAVIRNMTTRPATKHLLQFELDTKGDETNISQFALKVRWGRPTRLVKGKWQYVSAAPWNTRREFPGAFQLPTSGNVYIRTSPQRGPLRQVYGPNLARELVKAESAAEWGDVGPAAIAEVNRLVAGVLAGSIILGGRGYSP